MCVSFTTCNYSQLLAEHLFCFIAEPEDIIKNGSSMEVISTIHYTWPSSLLSRRLYSQYREELTMLKHVNSRDEFYELIKEGTVLVDFFATWCGPCKMLSPVLEQLSEEVDILIVKVDVDEVGTLAAQFGIQAVPTLMLFKNGQRVDVRMGYQNKNQLLAFINQ